MTGEEVLRAFARIVAEEVAKIAGQGGTHEYSSRDLPPDVRSVDRFHRLAAKCPGALTGAIEVRPIMELPADYAMPQQTATTA